MTHHMLVLWRADMHQLMVTLILRALLPLDLPVVYLRCSSRIVRLVKSFQGGQPPSYEAASIICTDMLALVDEMVARFGDNIAKCLTVSDILAAHDARKIAIGSSY
jgi:hypothetical protein